VTDLHHLGSWLLVIGAFLSLILLSLRSVQRLLGPPIVRLGSWILARCSSHVGELDQEADDLSKVLRRQQLCNEVQRLQRILAADEYMSATRQIANRLAYRQLLRELESTPAVYGAMPDYATASRWDTSTLPPSIGGPQPASTVEILDIGWRRRVLG
jgi:hypothetical protein